MTPSITPEQLQQEVKNLEAQLGEVVEYYQSAKSFEEQGHLQVEKNLVAFEKYLPNIAAECRTYDSSQLKLFVSKSGSANLFDESTQRWLYDENAKEQCIEQVAALCANPAYTKIAFQQEDSVDNTFIHSHYMRLMYQEFIEADKELAPLQNVPEHLGAGIVFGVGLGYHIEALVERVSFDHLYICEPRFDWFYASLFVIDWAAVLEKIYSNGGYLVLNLGASYKDFTIDYLNELRDKGSFYAANALIYQHYPSEELHKLIQQFQHDFHMLTVGWGFFDDGVISIAHDYHNLKNKIPMLRKNTKLPRGLDEIPVFICANGPSLDYSLDTIKQLKDKAIIFACGSAVVPLLQNGIVPDFHFEIERTRLTADWLIRFVSPEDLAKMNFLTANIMHPSCFPLFKWSGMAYKQTEPGTVLSHLFVPGGHDFTELKFCNPLVGNTALSYACALGFREVYMFGADNGYRKRDHHHSKHSVYYDADGNEKAEIGELVRAGEIVVDGNFGGNVYSTAFFNTGRFYLECLLKLYPKVLAYNTADGAKISGVSPLPIDDVLLMNTKHDKSQLLDYIKNDMFAVREFDDEVYQDWLAIGAFEELCQSLIAYVNKEFTSRKDLSIALREQARFLFAHSHTKYRHLYFLLEGSITYAHSVLRLTLYSFADEQASLRHVNTQLKIFVEYLQKAAEKYRDVLNSVDNQDSYVVMDLL